MALEFALSKLSLNISVGIRPKRATFKHSHSHSHSRSSSHSTSRQLKQVETTPSFLALIGALWSPRPTRPLAARYVSALYYCMSHVQIAGTLFHHSLFPPVVVPDLHFLPNAHSAGCPFLSACVSTALAFQLPTVPLINSLCSSNALRSGQVLRCPPVSILPTRLEHLHRITAESSDHGLSLVSASAQGPASRIPRGSVCLSCLVPPRHRFSV